MVSSPLSPHRSIAQVSQTVPPRVSECPATWWRQGRSWSQAGTTGSSALRGAEPIPPVGIGVFSSWPEDSPGTPASFSPPRQEHPARLTRLSGSVTESLVDKVFTEVCCVAFCLITDDLVMGEIPTITAFFFFVARGR